MRKVLEKEDRVVIYIGNLPSKIFKNWIQGQLSNIIACSSWTSKAVYEAKSDDLFSCDVKKIENVRNGGPRQSPG